MTNSVWVVSSMDVNDEGVHLEKHTECDARQHVVVHGPDCVLCHRASVETTMSDRKSSMREKDPTHGAASRSQCCKGLGLIVKHCEDGAVVVDGDLRPRLLGCVPQGQVFGMRSSRI